MFQVANCWKQGRTVKNLKYEWHLKINPWVASRLSNTYFPKHRAFVVSHWKRWFCLAGAYTYVHLFILRRWFFIIRYWKQILQGKHLFSYNASICQVRWAKKKELSLFGGSGTSEPQANTVSKTQKLHLSSVAPSRSLALAMPGMGHIVRWHSLIIGSILEADAIWST